MTDTELTVSDQEQTLAIHRLLTRVRNGETVEDILKVKDAYYINKIINKHIKMSIRLFRLCLNIIKEVRDEQ